MKLNEFQNGLLILERVTYWIQNPDRFREVVNGMKLNEEERNAQRNLANGGLLPHDYSIACQDCTYGRTFREARLNAHKAARVHAHRKIGHTVTVSDYGIAIKGYVYSQPTIPDWMTGE